MGKFRKKPAAIEAIQFGGGHLTAYEASCEAFIWVVERATDGVMVKLIHRGAGTAPYIEIEGPAGLECVFEGGWIIHGPDGKFSICDPDIFEATYEAVAEGVVMK